MNAIRISLLSLGIFLSLASSCKNRAQQKTEQGSTVQSDFSLLIQHTGCRGNCPDFSIQVVATGEVNWNGNRAVERMGNWRKTVTSKTVADLAAALDTYKFWDFSEGYGTGLADVPGIMITATHKGKKHRVWDIKDAPPELKKLEETLEKLVGDEGYVEVK